jgi:hypothetical protein
MWWILGGFLFLFALCRVMLASKHIDRFFASQDAETDSGAEPNPSRRNEMGRIVPFIKTRRQRGGNVLDKPERGR